MKTNSKSIGNNYEREVAKKLSEWITQGERDDVLWRDLSSGARGTTRKKSGKDSLQEGDFVATDLNYKWFTDAFYVDSKSYKECNFVFINEKNIKSNGIFNQWIKVCNDCPDNKVPVMVCKIRDRSTPEFVIVPLTFLFENELSIIYYEFEKYSLGYSYNCKLVLLESFFRENAKVLCEMNKK